MKTVEDAVNVAITGLTQNPVKMKMEDVMEKESLADIISVGSKSIKPLKNY